MSKQKLRTFKYFPKEDKCPICGTNEDKECFLIPITGTQEGNLAEAKAFHTGCLELMYDSEEKIIYQPFKSK